MRDAVDWSAYGYYIIHQTWKTTTIPKKRQHDVHSWKTFHPTGVLFVLWTDVDNAKLIAEYYPQYAQLYAALLLPVQRVDLIRLLYLHKYGGLYADLDYEVKCHLFDRLPDTVNATNNAVVLVRSDMLLNEVFQNSLMLSTQTQHPFWVACADMIQNIQTFINGTCTIGQCDKLGLFHNFFTKRGTNLIMTIYMTGPAVLDKTWLLHRHQNWELVELSPDLFFVESAPYATHHHANSWINLGDAFREIILATVFLTLLTVLCIVYIVKWVYIRKCQQALRQQRCPPCRDRPFRVGRAAEDE